MICTLLVLLAIRGDCSTRRADQVVTGILEADEDPLRRRVKRCAAIECHPDDNRAILASSHILQYVIANDRSRGWVGFLDQDT